MAQLTTFRPPLSDASIACRAVDGAYDGEPTVEALTDRFGASINVTIPPPKNAVYALTRLKTQAFGMAKLPT